MAIGAAIGAASFLIPTVLWIIESMMDDPTESVDTALQKLQAEQEQGVLQSESFDVKDAESREERYSLPVGTMLRDTELARQGILDSQLGIGTRRGGGNSDLLQAVAAKMGMDPRDLAERYNPRRIGDTGELTQSALFGGK
jgi:hypothetical protein